jgi:hypothetical protein
MGGDTSSVTEPAAPPTARPKPVTATHPSLVRALIATAESDEQPILAAAVVSPLGLHAQTAACPLLSAAETRPRVIGDDVRSATTGITSLTADNLPFNPSGRAPS